VLARRRRLLLPLRLQLLDAVLTLPVLKQARPCEWYVAACEGAAARRKVSVWCRTQRAGNIRRILDEMPKMGTGVEVLFVEGGSTDDTLGDDRARARRVPGAASVRALQQRGKGKKDATFLASTRRAATT